MPRDGVLLKKIQTRWGQYMPYLAVKILEEKPGGAAKVCFDNGYHPAGICHSAWVHEGSARITQLGKHRDEGANDGYPEQ